MPRAFELHLLNGLVLFHASTAFNKLYSQNIVCVSLICWTAAAAATTITAIIIIHFMCQRDGGRFRNMAMFFPAKMLLAN